MSQVRVRFAPSPTGYLHVGGARTALFNWLFARREKGSFILRIEDTDLARSSEDMVTGILEGLRWLGLDWDEGPYYQTQRLPLYQDFARRLLCSDRAYRCFCSPEELKARRERAQREKRSTSYEGTCRPLSEETARRRAEAAEPFAIRFKVEAGTTVVRDQVRGEVEFLHENLEDFVLLRSDGFPTYHLSVVVDDIDMRITHVIRGEDHISNTPKQILLYQAVGADLPAFAHLPLILGPDKKRLSKRHGATSVTEYRERGYLPEAMVNFLALLGWSPGDDREVFTLAELVREFSLERVGSGSPVFNLEKLDWFNTQHLGRLQEDDLFARLEKELEQEGLWDPAYGKEKREWFARVVALLKPRAKMVSDLARLGRPFFSEEVSLDPEASRKYLSREGLAGWLQVLLESWEKISPADFTHSNLETTLRQASAALGLKASDLIHPVRVAVSGTSVGPSLFELLELVGKERVLARLRAVAGSPRSASASPA
jgi:glutamyl-tRNA synthetase